MTNHGLYGFGLFCRTDIKKGEVFAEYKGYRVTHTEADEMEDLPYKNGTMGEHMLGSNDSVFVVGSTRNGSDARFENHRCNPNDHIVRRDLAGMGVFVYFLVAIQNIPAEVEITFQYGWMSKRTRKLVECACK